MTENQSKEMIVRNLRDAGCDDYTIKKYMDCMNKGDKKGGLKLLEKHRKALLGSVHTGEKQIDYLDYFLFQQNKTNTNKHL